MNDKCIYTDRKKKKLKTGPPSTRHLQLSPTTPSVQDGANTVILNSADLQHQEYLYWTEQKKGTKNNFNSGGVIVGSVGNGLSSTCKLDGIQRVYPSYKKNVIHSMNAGGKGNDCDYSRCSEHGHDNGDDDDDCDDDEGDDVNDNDGDGHNQHPQSHHHHKKYILRYNQQQFQLMKDDTNHHKTPEQQQPSIFVEHRQYHHHNHTIPMLPIANPTSLSKQFQMSSGSNYSEEPVYEEIINNRGEFSSRSDMTISDSSTINNTDFINDCASYSNRDQNTEDILLRQSIR